AVGFFDPVQLLDLAQVDDHLRLLEPILQPVHAVEAARQHPRVGTVPIEQPDRIIHAGWLIQLEDRHYVSDYRHKTCSLSGTWGLGDYDSRESRVASLSVV